MFKASAILKNAREDRELELSEISRKLKVPVKYLQAIESENIHLYPAEPYCSLITKDYANFLGLNGEEIVSLFRRDFAATVKTKSSTPQKVNFTPHFTFKVAVIASIIFFVGYLVSEYLKFNRPPSLKVNWPESVADQKSLEITGTTDPESTVRVNHDLVIVDSQGNFQKRINIASEEAKITIESQSPSGKTTVAEKTYRVE